MRRLALAVSVFALASASALAQTVELLGADTSPAGAYSRGAPVTGAGARSVVAELDRAAASLTPWRYVSLSDDMISLMVADEAGRRESYRLDGGREYVFQAACERICTDVDLEVVDEAGAVLASDRTDARWPAVTFTPVVTGRYTIHVWLRRCFEESCYVGVRGYGRAEP